MDWPTTPTLRRVKSRISSKSWQQRVAQAQRDEMPIRRILAEVERGASLNAAIAKVLPASRRSWALRRIPAYREHGFEALVDTRTPREPVVSAACRQAVQAAREADPRLTTAEALEILEGQRISPLPSESTIKREFARVDARRAYARKKAGRETRKAKVVELPFAGGELLAAGELETGGIAALTDEVVQLAERAVAASAGKTAAKDVAYRDARGHFTITYNRRRRRKHGEEIASYLRPAQDKAEGRVPSWPRFVRERRKTLDPKLRMLTFGWMVAGSKGWDSLRAPDVAGLKALTGFAYMPSTLAKFVSALAISGADQPLLEAVGRRWHEVAQSRWQEPGAMAALYIDNHAKEVWSSLFTLSGKVSHLNRVMPCIMTTYAHTGAGTPLVLSVQSGSAPLAPRLVDLVQRAENVLESDVRRAVVIDAEGCTFDLLESFAKAKRVLITPLKPSRIPELELTYTRGSYYRPYREHDELRIAQATLVHKSSGRSLDVGALLVRRAHRNADTVLLTTGLALGMEGRDLADLYYSRWPVQENAFKEAGVLGLSQHRGNCGRIVANVAVVTELERLESRSKRDAQTLRALTAEADALAQQADERARQHKRAESALTTRRRRFDDLIAQGKTGGKTFARVALDHQQALVHAEACADAATKARAVLDKNVTRRAAIETRNQNVTARKQRLEPHRAIRQLDVAQDGILTATKLTAAMLLSFVVREYLPSMPMTPQTFLQRVLPLRGRKELRIADELVVIYENPRDPLVNDALRDACARINNRQLRRDGRRLRFAVEPPPATYERFD
ncbi:MAG: hypothetical protein KKI08_28175 [Armatimonadetes bacterium]|nr:hypothetical protein [Armatimonadota bacterium]